MMNCIIMEEVMWKMIQEVKMYSCVFQVSLLVVLENPGRGISGVAPLGHPVVGDQLVAVRKELFKHLSVVISLL